MLDCPTAADDPRLPRGGVGEEVVIDGTAFITSPLGDERDALVKTWQWSVVNEGCDRILPAPRYGLSFADQAQVAFRPARPGVYRMQLEVETPSGGHDACEFDLNVIGRGLRVELCWNTSTQTDLDLYLHQPDNESPWYVEGTTLPSAGFNNATCNPANCPPLLRLDQPRVDWGYAESPIEYCDAYSTEAEFIAQGICPNPRASTDNNQELATGTAEVIQLDNPRHGQRFRIMVQNYSNGAAAPEVFVYCGSAPAYLGPPGNPPNFQAPGGQLPGQGFGVMWRPADVEVHTDGAGVTLGCEVEPLFLGEGPYVTIDDPSY